MVRSEPLVTTLFRTEYDALIFIKVIAKMPLSSRLVVFKFVTASKMLFYSEMHLYYSIINF